jgi:hypothetical protein
LENFLENITKKTLHPTTRSPRNPSHPPSSLNKECATRSYASETKSSMYAIIAKSMFELPKDGFRESIAAKAIARSSAYEGNTRLTCGLGKKSLRAKKGIVVDLGERTGLCKEKEKHKSIQTVKKNTRT